MKFQQFVETIIAVGEGAVTENEALTIANRTQRPDRYTSPDEAEKIVRAIVKEELINCSVEY